MGGNIAAIYWNAFGAKENMLNRISELYLEDERIHYSTVLCVKMEDKTLKNENGILQRVLIHRIKRFKLFSKEKIYRARIKTKEVNYDPNIKRNRNFRRRLVLHQQSAYYLRSGRTHGCKALTLLPISTERPQRTSPAL